MQINKIKTKDGTIAINYELPSESSESKIVDFTCAEPAKPDFQNALDALIEDLMELCGLDPEVWEDEGYISGATIKHPDDGGLGIVITGQCKIGNSVVVVNSPYIAPSAMYEQLEERIERLLNEARKYIEGDRAQVQQKLELGIWREVDGDRTPPVKQNSPIQAIGE